MVFLERLFNRIWKKLTFAFLAVTFLPIGYFMYQNLVNESSQVSDSATRDVIMNSFTRSRDVEATFLEVYQDINYLCFSNAMDLLVNQQGERGTGMTYWRSMVEKEFELFLSQRPEYAGAGFLDEFGDEKIVIYKVRGSPVLLPDKQKHNRLTSAYFVAAAKEKDYGVAAIPLTTTVNRNDDLLSLPFIRYATKVFDRGGHPKGILYLDINPLKIYAKLSRQTFELKRRAAMVTQTGNYIFNPFLTERSVYNPASPPRNIFEDYPDEVAAQILSGRNGMITDDAKNIFAFRAVYPRPENNEYFYVVFDRYPREDYLPKLERLKSNYMTELMWAFAFCITMAAAVSYTLTRNLGKLRDGVEMARKKMLGHRLNIRSGDEIESLANAYNAMAASLQEYSESLERKIEERSRHIHDVERQMMRSEKLAAIGFLAAGVAHEVNNPISVLITRLELIKREIEKGRSDLLQKDLDVLLAHSRRIGRIAGSLLAFSRGASAELVTGDINEVTERVMSLIEFPIRKKGVALSVSLGSGLPPITMNVAGMEQVIYNIVYNAFQATEPGGTVAVATSFDGEGKVALKISDTGHGMSPEVIKHIFEPFFTTKEVGSGSGLGLAISYGIIREIGGSINVESSPGRGTTFTILLVPAQGVSIATMHKEDLHVG